MMKPLILFSIILLLLTPVVLALPKLYYVNDTRVRFYDDRMNVTACLETLSYVPETYFTNLTAISFYASRNGRTLGMYFWGPRFFFTYRGRCASSTIIHELAHHQQYITGHPLSEALAHNGTFRVVQEKITEAYECNRWGYACWRLNQTSRGERRWN